MSQSPSQGSTAPASLPPLQGGTLVLLTIACFAISLGLLTRFLLRCVRMAGGKASRTKMTATQPQQQQIAGDHDQQAHDGDDPVAPPT